MRESAQALARAEARVIAARTFENPVLEGVREDPTGAIVVDHEHGVLAAGVDPRTEGVAWAK